jgi:beta-galactosidase
LGGNESGYVGFTRDITDYISFKTPNVIVVRADATQAEGWFYEGAGIYRNVWLNSYDNLSIADDVFVHTVVNGSTANVTIEATIQNQGLKPTAGSFYAEVTDRNGKLVGKTQSQSINIAQSGNQFVKQRLTLSNVNLWSIEQPYLYHIKPVVTVEGRQVDSRDIRFGVRTVEIKADGVFLNGKFIKIKGTNNHQDHAGLGAALPDYLQYYRIGLLKQMGSTLTAPVTTHPRPNCWMPATAWVCWYWTNSGC